MRRRDRAMPSPSEITSMARATLSKLYKGSPMPMKTMFGQQPVVLVGGPFAEIVLGDLHLGDDFRRGQVRTRGWVPVWQKVQSGCIPPARTRTGRRSGPRRGCKHSPPRCRRHADQPFARAVLRHLPLHHLGAGDDETLREGLLQVFGDVGHMGEFARACLVHPAPELAGASSPWRAPPRRSPPARRRAPSASDPRGCAGRPALARRESKRGRATGSS